MAYLPGIRGPCRSHEEFRWFRSIVFPAGATKELSGEFISARETSARLTENPAQHSGPSEEPRPVILTPPHAGPFLRCTRCQRTRNRMRNQRILPQIHSAAPCLRRVLAPQTSPAWPRRSRQSLHCPHQMGAVCRKRESRPEAVLRRTHFRIVLLPGRDQKRGRSCPLVCRLGTVETICKRTWLGHFNRSENSGNTK